jgi:hypothetical protein
LGFYNFPPTRFFTVPAYLQEGFAVFICNGVLMDCEVGMVAVIFVDRGDTIRIRFATDDGRRVMVQSVFDECPLVAPNIHNHILFFY